MRASVQSVGELGSIALVECHNYSLKVHCTLVQKNMMLFLIYLLLKSTNKSGVSALARKQKHGKV